MTDKPDQPISETSAAMGQAPHFRAGPPISLFMAGFATVCVLVGRWSQDAPGILDWLWKCPFKALSGLPCFTCGMTRVVLLFGQGRLWDAFALAPFPALVLGGSWVAGGWYLVARWTHRTPPDEWIARQLTIPWVRWLLVISFFGLWGYALVRSILTGAP